VEYLRQSFMTWMQSKGVDSMDMKRKVRVSRTYTYTREELEEKLGLEGKVEHVSDNNRRHLHRSPKPPFEITIRTTGE